MLKEKFITWISVSDRITKFHQRYLDYPTLLGSVDATVQKISRLKDDQQTFYSGKHKCYVVKVQGFVYTVGLLIHFTNCVPGSVHVFRLYKERGLGEMIQRENQNTQNLFGTNVIVLADSGYQGLSSRLPGALTPFKRTRGKWILKIKHL